MTQATNPHYIPTSLPDHRQLPESDGTFVKNFQEHPQSILLTDSIQSVLQRLHPDGQYCIGQDSGIYWRLIDPPEKGAEAPDWFYVPNVPPSLNGEMRRSYVLWQEYIPPLIVLEFVSGDGSAERDRTPWTGKFWVYEQVIRPAFYGIYDVSKASVEVYTLLSGTYQRLQPNQRGHFVIPALGVELGIWQGTYQNVDLPWLRWWNVDGELLLMGDERAQIADERAQIADERAQIAEAQLVQERDRAARLAAQLKALGVNPE
jgi:Uma2 family endonuclease